MMHSRGSGNPLAREGRPDPSAPRGGAPRSIDNPLNRPRPLRDKLWDLYAPFYDLFTSAIPDRVRQAYVDALRLSPADRLLIVGIGTGQDIPLLPDSVLIGIDLSSAMLARAARRMRSSPRLRGGLALMDAHDLGFREASFDRVLLPLVVAVAAEPRVLLREAARACRKGGLVVMFDKFRPAGSPPSLPRVILNIFSRAVATDITLDPAEISEGLPLVLVSDEPAFLGRQFRILVYEKTPHEDRSHTL